MFLKIKIKTFELFYDQYVQKDLFAIFIIFINFCVLVFIFSLTSLFLENET